MAKDAIFFSGHKFVGGPGTPGVLVVKKRLLCNAVPGTVGGGTVFFVTEKDHRYLRCVFIFLVLDGSTWREGLLPRLTLFQKI